MNIISSIRQQNNDHSCPSIVIVGANFAGLKAAISLPKKFRVTVVDPWPWFEFSPNIHELISGYKTPEILRFPKETAINRIGHTLVTESAISIKPEKNLVVTSSGKHLIYDYCIIAIGGITNTFNIRGAEKHAMPFKTVAQCKAIGDRLEYFAQKKRSFSIVIVGGGFEGVESLGEILRKYKDVENIEIHMIEKQDRLMKDAPADIDGELRRLCKPYPVFFHTNTRVSRVWKHSINLTNKTKLPSQITIWTGGGMPPPLLYESGLSKTPEQWSPVNTTLEHIEYPNIFVVGDAASINSPLSKQAYHALDMGKTAAENIVRCHSGKPLKDFKPSLKPMLVSLGDLDTFLIDKHIVVAGSAISVLKESVFQLVMTQLDPSGVLLKAIHASGRISTSAIKTASTMSYSLTRLAKLGRIRIIK
jgi:NADH dehydrogenase FAD-containing subunit